MFSLSFLALTAVSHSNPEATFSQKLTKVYRNFEAIANFKGEIVYRYTQTNFPENQRLYYRSKGDEVRAMDWQTKSSLGKRQETRYLVKIITADNWLSYALMIVESNDKAVVIRIRESVSTNGKITRSILYPNNYLSREWRNSENLIPYADLNEIGSPRSLPPSYLPIGILATASFGVFVEDQTLSEFINRLSDAEFLPAGNDKLFSIRSGVVTTSKLEWDLTLALPTTGATTNNNGGPEAGSQIAYRILPMDKEAIPYPERIKYTTWATINDKRIPIFESTYELLKAEVEITQSGDDLLSQPAELSIKEIEGSKILMP